MKLKSFALCVLMLTLYTPAWALSPESQALFDALKSGTPIPEKSTPQVTDAAPTEPSRETKDDPKAKNQSKAKTKLRNKSQAELKTPTSKASTKKSTAKSKSKSAPALSALSISFLNAAAHGTVDEVRSFLSMGVDVNVRDGNGEVLKKLE